jgi:LuxR family maltose regulon positive regulatory protein
MRDILLTTKQSIPAPRARLVLRQRLIDRLNAGFEHRLTVISAPAGFGKTTLLSEWARSCNQPVAWISLEASDNDPARFMAYLAAAMNSLVMTPATPELDPLSSVAPSSGETYLTTLLNRLVAAGAQTGQHYALLLDDYHTITNEAIHQGMAFVVSHQPACLHLYIATRTDPPLHLARLRARGQLNELRQDDLRFTLEESTEFLHQVMRLDLTRNGIAALAERAEGWVAGLQLAAISLQGRKDPNDEIASFRGSHHYVLDYLLEEVLYQQPPDIQEFLVRTSILEQLSAALCQAVVSSQSEQSKSSSPGAVSSSAGRLSLDCQATLEYLERANLFVSPVDGQRHWYRYHHLFADFLRARLEHQTPGASAILHQRAADWYQRQGMMDEAIEHALSAQAFDQVALLVEQAAISTLQLSQVLTLKRWIEAIPEKWLNTRPALFLYHAWTLLLSGQDLETVLARLALADQHPEAIPGQALVMRSFITVFQGKMTSAYEQSQLALQQLPPEEMFFRSIVSWLMGASQAWGGNLREGIRALDEAIQMSIQSGNIMMAVVAMSNQAEMLMHLGDLYQARERFTQALQLAIDSQGRPLPIAGIAMIGLGDLEREWNHLETAERLVTQGIELTHRWGQIGAFDGYIALARLHQARGNADAAKQAILDGLSVAERFDISTLDNLLIGVYQTQLWIAQGELQHAESWAQERLASRSQDLNQTPDDPFYAFMLDLEHTTLAWLRIAQGRYGDALALLERLLENAVRYGRVTGQIQVHILRALALNALGQQKEALSELTHAMTLGEPHSHLRTFLDFGPALVHLLQEAARQRPSSSYAHRLLEAEQQAKPALSSATDRPPGSNLTEPLSEREIEVLRLLAAGLSNQEIGEELFLATSTIKTHINHLYRKLQAEKRTQAVARGRELGLLP